MKIFNLTMPSLVTDIEKKLLIPTKIYKSKIGDKFTIEVVAKEPISFTSVLYKTEKQRDSDYLVLDDKVFWGLSFNPNTPIPGPPM